MEVVQFGGASCHLNHGGADNRLAVHSTHDYVFSCAAEKFHRGVAQLLYLATRVRPDILLPITFLCSRASEPTHEDLGKLHRALKYLNGSSHLGIILGKYGIDMALTVYADASYAVHRDCKSHGGIVVYLHRGPVFVKCSKQKMVSKSSTEAELITLSDVLCICLLTWRENTLAQYCVFAGISICELAYLACVGGGPMRRD